LKFAQICPKQALKYTIFVNIQKRPKIGQMAKPFYFWQTVSKKAKWQPCSKVPLSSRLFHRGQLKIHEVLRSKTK